MTDPASAARTARESLARGLAILQSPGVPPHLLDVAEPVAQAMGALHRIESSGGGALEQAPAALDAVRRALAQLQAASGVHPAVDQAMEAVAGSLGLVHGLTQIPAAAAPAPVAPAPVAAAPVAAAPAPDFGGTMVMGDQPAPQPAAAPAPQYQQQPAPAAAPQYPQQPAPQYHQQQPAPAAAPQYAQQQPAAQYQQQQPQQPAPHYQQQPQQFPQGAQGYGPPPAAAAAGAPWGNAPQQQPQQPAGSWPQHATPQPPQAASAPHHAAPAPPGPVPGVQVPDGMPRVDADLGAHSPSNFYKGLSGNDVIECGGIFVATYKIPKIGTNLAIKVALPGGYEFEALGVVEWVREAPNSTAGIEAPPGFGAKFTQITPEGRQLVYRYVRNREPLFHDDL